MAHFVLEYSDNISEQTLALPTLFEKLHRSAAETGIFPLKGLRSRAYACRHYRIADGNPEHIFIHLTVLIGAGRSPQERELVARIFFVELEQHFSRCFLERGVAMSFELKELEPVLKYNRNNLDSYLER